MFKIYDKFRHSNPVSQYGYKLYQYYNALTNDIIMLGDYDIISVHTDVNRNFFSNNTLYFKVKFDIDIVYDDGTKAYNISGGIQSIAHKLNYTNQ